MRYQMLQLPGFCFLNCFVISYGFGFVCGFFFSLNKLGLKNGTSSSKRSRSMETNQSSLIQELSY